MHWVLGKIVTAEAVIERGAVGIEQETIRFVGPAASAPRDPRDSATDVGTH